MQLRHVLGREHRVTSLQLLYRMRTVLDGDAGRARVIGHEQVVRRVADHNGATHVLPQFPCQFLQHCRMRFGKCLVGATGRIEGGQQAGGVQRAVQPDAALVLWPLQKPVCAELFSP